MSRKRRIASAILCACFLFRLACAADAPEAVYFVAAENIVLPLRDDDMPFWNDNYLYISGENFTGAVRDALGISRAKIGDGLLLYRGGKSLLFRRSHPYALDQDENTYAPGMIWRNETCYVPAAVVARYFDLLYSVVDVEHGKLVWLRNSSFRMNDAAFAKAATFQLNQVYREYAESAEPEPIDEPDPIPPEESETRQEPADFPEPSGEPEWPTPSEPETPVEPADPQESAPPDEPSEPSAPDTSVTPSNPTTNPEKPSNPTAVAPDNPITKPDTPSKPTTTAPVTPSNPTTTTPVTPSNPTPTTPVTPENPTITSPVTPDNPNAVADPEPPPVTEPEPLPDAQQICLCLRGTDTTETLLEVLDRHELRAAVFCDETFLNEHGDLVRRMVATGYRIGLYARGDTENVAETLEACNQQLFRVAMEKTRLAFAEGAGEETLRAVRDAGFLCLRPTLDRAESPLRTSRQAQALLKDLSGEGETLFLLLGESVNRSGLNAFLTSALEVGDAFPALVETDLS